MNSVEAETVLAAYKESLTRLQPGSHRDYIACFDLCFRLVAGEQEVAAYDAIREALVVYKSGRSRDEFDAIGTAMLKSAAYLAKFWIPAQDPPVKWGAELIDDIYSS